MSKQSWQTMILASQDARLISGILPQTKYMDCRTIFLRLTFYDKINEYY